MKAFKERTCVECSAVYLPTGPAGRYCKTCAAIKRKEADVRKDKVAKAKAGVHLGVGSGGRNLKGKDNPRYSSGVGVYSRAKRTMHKEVRYCNRCSADLLNVHWSMRCVHHKDHDRNNNELENFELLCKRCHQVEHKSHKNFKGKP